MIKERIYRKKVEFTKVSNKFSNLLTRENNNKDMQQTTTATDNKLTKILSLNNELPPDGWRPNNSFF